MIGSTNNIFIFLLLFFYIGKCINCPTGCSKCTDENVCTQCYCPWVLRKGICLSNDDLILDPENCDKNICSDGYYLVSHYKCSKCRSECKKCISYDYCTECACLYTLINHQCFRPVGTPNYENCDEIEYQQNLVCRHNEFAKNGKCITCAPICKTCKNSNTTCTSCNEGYTYFSNNNTCYSKGNYFMKINYIWKLLFFLFNIK